MKGPSCRERTARPRRARTRTSSRPTQCGPCVHRDSSARRSASSDGRLHQDSRRGDSTQIITLRNVRDGAHKRVPCSAEQRFSCVTLGVAPRAKNMSKADASASLSALTALSALSPLDGRYRSKLASLARYFSETALIRERIRVEIVWLKALAEEGGVGELPSLSAATRALLDDAVARFDAPQAERVKAIEQATNHDVKAIEYWLKERFA